MRIDLFELLDGLFRGVVYFLYNLVDTFLIVVRHPLRGPPLLYRRHKDPARRQIAGLTFILLAYLPFYAWFLELHSDAPGTSGMLATMPTLPGDSWWPALAACVGSVVLVDALLRVEARRRGLARRTRERLIGTTEYALFIPLPLATFIGMIFWEGWERHLAEYLSVALPIFAVTVVAAFPAAAAFWPIPWSHARAKARVDGKTTMRAIIFSGSIWGHAAALAALVFGAGVAGGTIVEYVSDLRTDEVERVEIVDAQCYLAANQPFVDALFVNRTRKPVLARASEFQLYVGKLRFDDRGSGEWSVGRGGARVRLAGHDGNVSEPVMIPAGAAAIVRGWPVGLPPERWPEDTECALGAYLGGLRTVRGGPWRVRQPSEFQPLEDQSMKRFNGWRQTTPVAP